MLKTAIIGNNVQSHRLPVLEGGSVFNLGCTSYLNGKNVTTDNQAMLAASQAALKP